jgi:hypothetical protein
MLRIGLAIGALFLAASANATVWSTNYDFQAHFATAEGSVPPPITDVSVSFTIETDDATSKNVLTEFSFDLGSKHFDEHNTGTFWAGGNSFGIGAKPYFNGVGPNTTDFFIDWSQGDLTTAEMVYTDGSPYIFFSSSGTITQDGAGMLVPPTVPEPATWAMLVTGFGLVGGSLRTRRRTVIRFG